MIFTRRQPNSRARALLSLTVASAMTARLSWSLPSSASRRTAPPESEGLLNTPGQETLPPRPRSRGGEGAGAGSLRKTGSKLRGQSRADRRASSLPRARCGLLTLPDFHRSRLRAERADAA